MCFLGSSINVIGPEQLIGDIYTYKREPLVNFHFSNVDADWAMHYIPFPVVINYLLPLVDNEGEVVVLTPFHSTLYPFCTLSHQCSKSLVNDLC